jgi:hypothetical protein
LLHGRAEGQREPSLWCVQLARAIIAPICKDRLPDDFVALGALRPTFLVKGSGAPAAL